MVFDKEKSYKMLFPSLATKTNNFQNHLSQLLIKSHYFHVKQRIHLQRFRSIKLTQYTAETSPACAYFRGEIYYSYLLLIFFTEFIEFQ